MTAGKAARIIGIIRNGRFIDPRTVASVVSKVKR